MITPEIEELKRIVEEEYGKGINTTTDFEEFSFYLQKRLDRKVSASTLKRIWGYVNDEHKPRMGTLDALAEFAGHHDFLTFKRWLKTSIRYNSSFFDANLLTSTKLPVDKEITIGWSPNRLLRLRHLGKSQFEVIEAKNSKLKPHDKFFSVCFILGQPLYLPYIDRDGKHTPPFIAGRNGGLTIIKV